MNAERINWWRTSFGEKEIDAIADAIRQESVSQGEIASLFEKEVAEILGVKHVVATSNGTAALSMALMAVGVAPGDEVIVPNRTWIATAHAAYVLGAKIILADVEENRPIIDVESIESQISSKTKAIIPVHMNGRAANIEAINKLGNKFGIAVIEDAAQAFFSRNSIGYLGTLSDIGCFSLSVAKLISSGQGGFAVTNSDQLMEAMRNIRTHGVEQVLDPDQWGRPGFNFRFTDVHASIARIQLTKLNERVNHCKAIYELYRERLADVDRLHIIPVDDESGEIAIYNEYLCESRNYLIGFLEAQNIQCRPFYPNLDLAPYLAQGVTNFPNSKIYSEQGIYLPSGPEQSLANIDKVIDVIRDSEKSGLW